MEVKRTDSIRKKNKEVRLTKKEFRRDIFYFALYLLCLGFLLRLFLFDDNSDLNRVKAFIEMCKTLGQASISIVLGYVALFAGLAAIYYKNDEEFTIKHLALSIRLTVYFCISSLLMLVFSFLPVKPKIIWALQDGVIPVTALFILNQTVFILLNHHALKLLRRIVKK